MSFHSTARWALLKTRCAIRPFLPRGLRRPRSCDRHQLRLEHEPVTDDGHRLRLPRLGIARQPPLTALPVGDLRRVLAEDHPVEALLPHLCRGDAVAHRSGLPVPRCLALGEQLVQRPGAVAR